MSKPKTYVAIILDQSGSMCTTKAQAVRGYNEQVQQMKLNSKDQDIFCCLVTFNGEVYEHLWCEPADKLTEASVEDYKTEGSTAMCDAVGYTIEKLKKTTNDKEDVAYLVVIVSDGEENASQHYKSQSSALRELKESVDRTGKWTFTYMGCDERYLKKVAQEMSIPLSNVAKWSNDTPELAAMGMHFNSTKQRSYYRARVVGHTAQKNVYSDTAGLADFTEDTGNWSDIKNPYVPPIDMNVSNVLNKTTCDGSTPFKNYNPVNWQV